MRRKLWAVIVMLLVITSVYPVALYLSISRYDAWKQAEIQRYNSLRVFPSDAEKWLDFDLYIGTFEGGLLLILGTILACCWLMIMARHGKRILFNP